MTLVLLPGAAKRPPLEARLACHRAFGGAPPGLIAAPEALEALRRRPSS